MSHFTRVAVQITSQTDLIAVLKQLGYTTIQTTRVKGYSGNEIVEFVVEPAQGGYQIGFRKNDEGNYEIVADWWGVHGLTEKKFTSSIKVMHAERKVRAFAKQHKYLVKEEATTEGKVLVLIGRRYI